MKNITKLTLSLIATAFLVTIHTSGACQTPEPEYGKAAYYSDKLQGRKTSSGEPYDKAKLTCAHKTHPFGTTLRITRVDNNMSVLVKVNDRGPFHEGYVVDLSRAAAEKIDLVKAGVARVKVEVADNAATVAATAVPPTNPAPPPPASAQAATGTTAAPTTTVNRMLPAQVNTPPAQPATAAAAQQTASAAQTTAPQAQSKLFQVQITPEEKKGYGIQLAVLSNTSQLLEELAKMKNVWPGKVLVAKMTDDKGSVTGYKLLVGPYPDKETAAKAQKAAASKGYPKCFVVALDTI
ncbi:MAG: septal ring lytic transglycosylase RlpA family protein [Saprospiraceae bacterium]|nr:septal ring lytic transglycosylase RlpA family protein [Saprospiraceae bacterium]